MAFTDRAAFSATAAPPLGAAAGSSQRPNLTPEQQKKLAAIRAGFLVNFAQAVLAISMVPRYRHQSLADLQQLLLEPMIRDRVAVATTVPPSPTATEGAANPRLGGDLARSPAS